MIDLGFMSASAFRMLIAGLFAAAAFFAVLSIEHQSTPTVTNTPTVVPPMLSAGPLIIETTYPVTKWHIQMQGKDVIPEKFSAYRCEVTVIGNLDNCFIEAEIDDPLSTAPSALRWQRGEENGIIWGQGSVAAMLKSK